MCFSAFQCPSVVFRKSRLAPPRPPFHCVFHCLAPPNMVSTAVLNSRHHRLALPSPVRQRQEGDRASVRAVEQVCARLKRWRVGRLDRFAHLFSAVSADMAAVQAGRCGLQAAVDIGGLESRYFTCTWLWLLLPWIHCSLECLHYRWMICPWYRIRW